MTDKHIEDNLPESENCFTFAYKLSEDIFSDSKAYYYYPVFIDISNESDRGKPDPSIRLRFENKIDDAFNANYLLNSKKIIEVYRKKFAEKAENFATEFKKRYNQDFYIIHKF